MARRSRGHSHCKRSRTSSRAGGSQSGVRRRYGLLYVHTREMGRRAHGRRVRVGSAGGEERMAGARFWSFRRVLARVLQEVLGRVLGRGWRRVMRGYGDGCWGRWDADREWGINTSAEGHYTARRATIGQVGRASRNVIYTSVCALHEPLHLRGLRGIGARTSRK